MPIENNGQFNKAMSATLERNKHGKIESSLVKTTVTKMNSMVNKATKINPKDSQVTKESKTKLAQNPKFQQEVYDFVLRNALSKGTLGTEEYHSDKFDTNTIRGLNETEVTNRTNQLNGGITSILEQGSVSNFQDTEKDIKTDIEDSVFNTQYYVDAIFQGSDLGTLVSANLTNITGDQAQKLLEAKRGDHNFLKGLGFAVLKEGTQSIQDVLVFFADIMSMVASGGYVLTQYGYYRTRYGLTNNPEYKAKMDAMAENHPLLGLANMLTTSDGWSQMSELISSFGDPKLLTAQKIAIGITTIVGLIGGGVGLAKGLAGISGKFASKFPQLAKLGRVSSKVEGGLGKVAKVVDKVDNFVDPLGNATGRLAGQVIAKVGAKVESGVVRSQDVVKNAGEIKSDPKIDGGKEKIKNLSEKKFDQKDKKLNSFSTDKMVLYVVSGSEPDKSFGIKTIGGKGMTVKYTTKFEIIGKVDENYHVSFIGEKGEKIEGYLSSKFQLNTVIDKDKLTTYLLDINPDAPKSSFELLKNIITQSYSKKDQYIKLQEYISHKSDLSKMFLDYVENKNNNRSFESILAALSQQITKLPINDQILAITKIMDYSRKQKNIDIVLGSPKYKGNDRKLYADVFGLDASKVEGDIIVERQPMGITFLLESRKEVAKSKLLKEEVHQDQIDKVPIGFSTPRSKVPGLEGTINVVNFENNIKFVDNTFKHERRHTYNGILFRENSMLSRFQDELITQTQGTGNKAKNNIVDLYRLFDPDLINKGSSYDYFSQQAPEVQTIGNKQKYTSKVRESINTMMRMQYNNIPNYLEILSVTKIENRPLIEKIYTPSKKNIISLKIEKMTNGNINLDGLDGVIKNNANLDGMGVQQFAYFRSILFDKDANVLLLNLGYNMKQIIDTFEYIKNHRFSAKLNTIWLNLKSGDELQAADGKILSVIDDDGSNKLLSSGFVLNSENAPGKFIPLKDQE